MESTNTEFDYITFEALMKLDSSKYLLVDVRPSATYRGWPNAEGKLGGHLQGAVNLGGEWNYFENPDKTTECLKR
jgi:3-mercaptopyruvate sulfurtransferase SseA